MIAKTPQPPYYVVIFTSIRMNDDRGYSKMAETMIELAQRQNGFIGVESARDELGITVSYWKNTEAIKKWKENAEHLFAQKLGKKQWYKSYKVRVAKVERDYGI